MYEEYYGFSEKPFSLTPDPKYLYRSESHASAFELMQYAIRRREGFVVITGDIGTGKTTLCRAILEQLDRRTFTALVLNPFLSAEDLLRQILQDFGVVSREEVKRGRLGGVSRQELIDTLNEFLLSLLPLRAGAMLIIDEAQNLAPQVLEQIRILSNLETDKEKLLQIVLVGQLNLQSLLRSPELRQLAQRVSIRYELQPLSREESAAYIAHRLTIAGGGAVSFSPAAVDRVHRYACGIPRLINLLCDRALVGGFSERTSRITPDIIVKAAESLDLQPPPGRLMAAWSRHRAAVAATALVLSLFAASTFALQRSGWLWRTPSRPPAAGERAPARSPVPSSAAEQAVATAGDTAAAKDPIPASPSVGTPIATDPPGGSTYSILVGSFRLRSEATSLTAQLAEMGYAAFQMDVDLGPRGIWRQVLVGRYADADRARADEARLKQIPGYADAHLIRN
jgi:general secretion pathway protein A